MPTFEEILREYGSNPFEAFWFIFRHGGGLILIPVFIRIAIKGWLFWIQEHYKHHVPHTMFKVEVPQNNEQSMKAIEQIFVSLYGTYNEPDWWEKWWQGFVQEEFSFEIVSDGGYITYYVRTPRYYAEMTQAAFYAQYPDAILTEVEEDYVKQITVDDINSGKIKVWGSEMKLEGPDVRPIKPWPAWEHQLQQKAVDPLSAILEFMSRLQPGEKLWYQIMAMPANLPHFKHLAQEAIDEVVEPNGAHHGGPDIVDHIQNAVLGFLGGVHKTLFGGEDDHAAHDEGGLTERQRLTTPEREFVEEVDRKASRWPFETKVRFMYFAAPAIWDGKKARRGMLGGLKLYRFINAFAEGTLTRTDWGCLPFRYVFPERRLLTRARKMYWAYKSRDMERGEHEGFHLSTEELASIFHFPSIEVRAPFIAKAQSRGVEPPTLLRYDEAEAISRGPQVALERGGEVHAATDSAEPAVPTANVVAEADAFAQLQAAAYAAKRSPEVGAAQSPSAVTPILPNQPESSRAVDLGAAAGSAATPIADDPDLAGPQPPSNIPFV